MDYIGLISLQTAEYVYNYIVCHFLIFVSDVAINLFPFVQSSYLSIGQCMMKILPGNEKEKKKERQQLKRKTISIKLTS